MSKIDVVVGGQFGSEGKGAIAGWLAQEHEYAAVVRVAGPNAGHSAYDPTGRKWALRQIPVAAVVDHEVAVVIGAGSEIDQSVLSYEIQSLQEAGIPIRDRLYIDRSATLIEDVHKQAEGQLTLDLGSTGKGIGAARADRLMRDAKLYGGYIDTTIILQEILNDGGRVMIEGTQGYGLGLHQTDYYPYTTSSDCRAIDFMAMAGISPWGHDVHPWVVLRTFPIRVAGNSGPLEGETTWDSLHAQSEGYINPEQTTVTGKTRRVGIWDSELARDAVRANSSAFQQPHVALTFFDYWFPELQGSVQVSSLTEEHQVAIRQVEDDIGAAVHVLGTGPDSAIRLREIG